jgi:hypothetical protein
VGDDIRQVVYSKVHKGWGGILKHLGASASLLDMSRGFVPVWRVGDMRFKERAPTILSQKQTMHYYEEQTG